MADWQEIRKGERVVDSPTKREPYRILEVALIILFVLGTTALVIVNPSQGAGVVEELPSNETIQAYAYAMPADGWSPLAVYFSAFGSRSSAGRIVKYEWDLDANGLYDTDASETGGYTSNLYKRSGEYAITLKVTDEQGNVATDKVTVRVRYPGSSSVDYWTVFDDSQVRRVAGFFPFIVTRNSKYVTGIERVYI